MTANYWQGTDGNWNTAANWSLTLVPTAAHEVIFDGRVSQSVTTGPTTKGVVYPLLHVKSSFTGSIGLAAERIHCQPTKVIFEGTGTMYLECSAADAVTDSVIPLVILNSVGGTLYLTSDVNTSSWVAVFTQVWTLQGTLYIGDTSIDTWVASLYIAAKDGNESAVVVYVKEDCERLKATAAKMSIYLLNGTCTSDSAAALIQMADGTFNYGTDLGASPEAGMDIDKLIQYGGTFNWSPDDSGNPYIAEGYLYGGTFDASGTTNNDHAKVLGNGAGYDFYVFSGATLDIANGKGNITVAANSKIRNYGGSILLDSNTIVAPSYDV